MLRGIGKQKFGAILNAVSYYGVGMPLAAVLLFVAKIGVIGTDPWALHPPNPPPGAPHTPCACLCPPSDPPGLTGVDWDGSCSCWELLLGKSNPKAAPDLF